MARRKADQDALTRSLTLFGAQLRFHREKKNLSQKDLADLVHCARSLIGMIETGQRAPVDDSFPARCDTVLETGGALEEMWTEITKQEEAERPAWFRDYVDIERKSITIRQFQLQWIPGILQTEEYARALFERAVPGQTEVIEARLASRMRRRQFLLSDDGPMFVGVIDEAVLHRGIGSVELMRRQLADLIEQSKRPNVVIQVLPLGVLDVDLFDSSITLLSLPDEPDLLYIEALNHGQLISTPMEIARGSHRYDVLRSHALSRSESRDLIRRIMEGLTNKMQPTAHQTWRKSSYSSGDEGQCIEIADGLPTIPVRDSKDPHGPALSFPAPAWASFVTALRTGEIPDPRI
ncbi:Scr1 family TA system antitoxin-like transcriptional regulator [Kitasatospora sp. LaBMicrA B282]|uniref:Scr1 family TA system antitoxin-like transcriptional regulator n=1 Tax=Kitasatospora sp. LaBMicrA B282 TaxID=3420949 RepID=UPI003D09A4ED